MQETLGPGEGFGGAEVWGAVRVHWLGGGALRGPHVRQGSTCQLDLSRFVAEFRH